MTKSVMTLRELLCSDVPSLSEVSMICNLDGSPTTASGELYESGSDLGADWSPSQAEL